MPNNMKLWTAIGECTEDNQKQQAILDAEKVQNSK